MFLEKVYLGVEKLKKLRNTEANDDGYLSHHGIKGQQWGVKNGPPYPIHRDAAYNTANDIYNKLDTFDYGCIIDGKRYNETNLDEVNWSKYRTTPVEDFEKTKIGTCWDYTNYQHEKLKEAGIDHTTRMIVMDTDIGPVTHTFTTFQDSTGQKYWLEQALYSERGIHPIEDYTDAVDVISNRYDSSKKRAFDVYEFNPDGMDKGLSDQEFFNRATSGDPIFQRKESTKSSNDILKQYDNQTLTKDAIREYKSQAPQLSHVRVNKNTTGELYFKNGKLAGMVNTEKKDDGTVWIQGIEVYGDNQGKGLGYSMLDHAVKDLGATNLSVNKKNDRAKMIYDKYGFETYDEDSTMYYMKYE